MRFHSWCESNTPVLRLMFCSLLCVRTSAGLWGELAANVVERGKEILMQVLEKWMLNFFGHCSSPIIS